MNFFVVVNLDPECCLYFALYIKKTSFFLDME